MYVLSLTHTHVYGRRAPGSLSIEWILRPLTTVLLALDSAFAFRPAPALSMVSSGTSAASLSKYSILLHESRSALSMVSSSSMYGTPMWDRLCEIIAFLLPLLAQKRAATRAKLRLASPSSIAPATRRRGVSDKRARERPTHPHTSTQTKTHTHIHSHTHTR